MFGPPEGLPQGGALEVFRESLRLGLAMQALGRFTAADWADLGVALLLAGIDCEAVAELAAVSPHAGVFELDEVLASLAARLSLELHDRDQAVEAVAQLLARSLRIEPTTVTFPITRMLARLGAPNRDDQSALVERSWWAEEYMDCGCNPEARAQAEGWEVELQSHPGPSLPESVVHALAAPLRSRLPATTPASPHPEVD